MCRQFSRLLWLRAAAVALSSFLAMNAPSSAGKTHSSSGCSPHCGCVCSNVHIYTGGDAILVLLQGGQKKRNKMKCPHCENTTSAHQPGTGCTLNPPPPVLQHTSAGFGQEPSRSAQLKPNAGWKSSGHSAVPHRWMKAGHQNMPKSWVGP